MNALKSEAFYFPIEQKQLFVIHYPANPQAASALQPELVLMCPPLPQEMMRAHAMLSLLGKQLANLGLDVYRFDYSGTGDSSGCGDEMRLDTWLDEILALIAELKLRHPGMPISLLGLRLGAALAIQASSKANIAKLILWDPVLDGLDYMYSMEAAQTQMFSLDPIQPPHSSYRYSSLQCWGFPWSREWRSELAAISPALLKPKAQKIIVLQSAADTKLRSLLVSWDKAQLPYSLDIVGEPMFWGDPRYMKIRALGTHHLQRILGFWEETKHG